MDDKDVVVVCFFVKDFKAEMAKIPTDVNVVALVVVESNIPKVEVGVLERFGPTLERMVISHSMVEDVEDHAFKGLTNVRQLSMRLNVMKEIRAGWMNDMTDLVEVDFNSNGLTHVDKDVDVSKLERVDLGENRFECMDMDMMNRMKNVKSMRVGMNPLAWKCMIEMEDWMKNHPNVVGDFTGKELGLEHLFEVVRECMKTVNVDDDQVAMDACVESKMNVVSRR